MAVQCHIFGSEIDTLETIFGKNYRNRSVYQFMNEKTEYDANR